MTVPIGQSVSVDRQAYFSAADLAGTGPNLGLGASVVVDGKILLSVPDRAALAANQHLGFSVVDGKIIQTPSIASGGVTPPPINATSRQMIGTAPQADRSGTLTPAQYQISSTADTYTSPPAPTGSGATKYAIATFGCAGDGTTDDSTKIVNAINGLSLGDVFVFEDGHSFYCAAQMIFSNMVGNSLSGNTAAYTVYMNPDTGTKILRSSANGKGARIESPMSDWIGWTSDGPIPTTRTGSNLQGDCPVSVSRTNGAGTGTQMRGVRLFNCRSLHSTAAGFFNYGVANVTYTDCLTVGSLADGIHFTSASSDSIVNRHVSDNVGDDGVAIVSYGTDPDITQRIEINSPHITNSGNGRGLSIIGGRDIAYKDFTVGYRDLVGSTVLSSSQTVTITNGSNLVSCSGIAVGHEGMWVSGLPGISNGTYVGRGTVVAGVSFRMSSKNNVFVSRTATADGSGVVSIAECSSAAAGVTIGDENSSTHSWPVYNCSMIRGKINNANPGRSPDNGAVLITAAHLATTTSDGNAVPVPSGQWATRKITFDRIEVHTTISATTGFPSIGGYVKVSNGASGSTKIFDTVAMTNSIFTGGHDGAPAYYSDAGTGSAGYDGSNGVDLRGMTIGGSIPADPLAVTPNTAGSASYIF